MRPIPDRVRERRQVVVSAAMLFIVVLLMVQMWLLTATLEAYLAGHHQAALPGFVVSVALFVVCFAIYRFVARIDTEPDRQASS